MNAIDPMRLVDRCRPSFDFLLARCETRSNETSHSRFLRCCRTEHGLKLAYVQALPRSSQSRVSKFLSLASELFFNSHFLVFRNLKNQGSRRFISELSLKFLSVPMLALNTLTPPPHTSFVGRCVSALTVKNSAKTE